jgi:hypothetical protein
MPTIEVIRSTPPALGRCRHQSCQRRIEWVRTITNDKGMPLDHPVTLISQHEREGGGFVALVDSGASHFVTCPAAAAFRKRGRRQ